MSPALSLDSERDWVPIDRLLKPIESEPCLNMAVLVTVELLNVCCLLKNEILNLMKTPLLMAR